MTFLMFYSNDAVEIFATVSAVNHKLCDLLIVSAEYKIYILIKDVPPIFEANTSREAFDVILSGLENSSFNRHTCL